MKEIFKTWRLLIIALVLLALGLIVYFSHMRNIGEPVDRMFYVDPGEEVVRVVLNDRQGNEVTLEKTAEGWRLNDQYRVNDPALEDLLATLQNLRIRYPVPQARQNIEQQGILVEVYVSRYLIPLPGDNGLWPTRRLHRSIMVGEDAADGEGTYMMVPGSDQGPYVVQVPGVTGGLREVFMAREASWRDPVLIDLQPAQISKVHVSWILHPERSFALHADRELPQILAGPQNLPLQEDLVDQRKVNRYLSGFTDLYYERLLLEEPDTMMFPRPFLELEVSSHQGQSISLTCFRRKASKDPGLQATTAAFDPDRFYIQLENGRFAIAQYFVFNRIMRPVSFFVAQTEE